MQKAKVVKDLHGQVIAPYDLPPQNARWTPQRKSVVVLAVRGGILTLQEALNRYHMTEAEFRIWEKEIDDGGLGGLRITKYQANRLAKKRAAAE